MTATTDSLIYPLAPRPRISLRVISTIVAGHIAMLALLASIDVVPVPQAVTTLVVDLIQPAAPPQPQETTKPQPRPVDVKPQPRRMPNPVPQPILSTQADNAAAAIEVPLNRDTPPPAPPAPVTVSQPRFDADYLSNPPPAYPPLSRRMGEEGKVVLRVFVEPAGRPSQIELKSSSGSPRLDQAAQEAVWRWKFISAKRGDEAVGAWVLVPIVFTLKH